ncbi:MAG: DsrE family protein [Oscillospiraceae bacterium]
MDKDRLVIVWLSVDKQAALDMAMLYARDGLLQGWWKQVELILWGPSVEMAAENDAIQQELSILRNIGVTVSACLACAVRYGVTSRLGELGLDVRGMGESLTEYLKSGVPILMI